MFRKSVLFFFTFLGFYALSQEGPSYGDIESHAYYVNQLTNSKDQNFQDILRRYDAYIMKHPNDVTAQVERCKFIGNSYWDEYEDYNLKWEETDACIEELVLKYPESSQVLLYQADNVYGEAKLEILNRALALTKTNEKDWSNIQMASINAMLGDYHQEENWRALSYYKKAQRLNDSLDLSLAIATIYQAQDKPTEAKNVLLPNLEKDTNLWKMNRKANLLLKLDEPQAALDLYDIIRIRDSSFIDNEEMANAMNRLKNFATAREFLVRDTIKEWGKLNAKQALFSHDLVHSEAKIALESYRSLQEESSYDDFFGLKRLRISLKDPFLVWHPSEFFHLALLLILVLAALVLPYLWILPIYGAGDLLKRRGITIIPKLNFSWNITHFWVVSFFYLVVQVTVVFMFEYQDTLNYYFDLGNSFVEETIDQLTLANSMIVFVVLMAASTLFVLRKDRIKDVFRSNMTIRQMIGLGVIFVVFNRIFIKVLGLFVDIESPTIESGMYLTVQEEILAVMSQNGFLITVLLVAVIVPIYEEIVFRGVILASSEKRVGFKAANVIQAVLFASVHDNLSLFPFFFVFALITGYWVRRSGGLLTGIIFHGLHNFLILVGLYYLSKLQTFELQIIPRILTLVQG
jgi:membrane protease YdiL (CAAX protease family)